jgi:hypothetical protein
MANHEIAWAPRTEWDHAAYSLNIRLHRLVGNTRTVWGLSEECRQKFGREPDIVARSSDLLYSRPRRETALSRETDTKTQGG